LAKMWLTCASTVRFEMTSRAAMSRLDSPRATSTAISRSRVVRPSLPSQPLISSARGWGRSGSTSWPARAAAAISASGLVAPAVCSSAYQAVPSVPAALAADRRW
jgi:hypothetical protein